MTQHAWPQSFGPQVTPDGVDFRLYAPDADSVELLVEGHTPIAMDGEGGWKHAHVPHAGDGTLYCFRLPGGLVIPDPASRFQPEGLSGPSRVVVPGAYRWSDANWRGRPWPEAVIYEAHVGAATPEGTYAAFGERLEDLAALGVTAIELMPLAQWRGARNWGYDGVLPFAPCCAYGEPDDLRAFIDLAHAHGLMVFIDVVYNHFGPSGNYLHAYARSFFTERHQTPWGAAINFDDEGREAARAFFVENAVHWIAGYHADGLRFDAVHAIRDESEPHILADISQAVKAAAPDRHVHLILENDSNESRWLERGPDDAPRFYTAQWNDDAHHCWHALLTGEHDGYYADFAQNAPVKLARSLAEGFVYQGDPSPFRDGELRGEPSAHLHPAAFIDFLQNHDQVGNRAFGERIDAIADAARVASARAALLLSPHIPLLFMGEEWGARTPFLYFVDFAEEPDLATAVREGRRREFQGFAEFAHGGSDEIPDPNALVTFARSKLDDDEAARAEHRDIYARTRELLALRRRHVTPLLASRFIEAHVAEGAARGLVDVTWRFEAGSLRIAINLGPQDAHVAAEEAESFHICGTVSFNASQARLAPWSLVALGGAR